MTNQSEKIWLDLWSRIGARGDGAAVYKDLAARHNESHRFYHTLVHVMDCLSEFEQVRHLAQNPYALELAIWYHDAVYDTKANDNEERSAKLAIEMMQRALLPDDFSQTVANLILATKHAEIPADPDAQLMVDIDLAILGQSEERFDEYERQIRKEYQWVPDNAFAIGRSAILKSFLDRLVIYLTWFFRNKYEFQARRNIFRSLAQLSDRP